MYLAPLHSIYHHTNPIPTASDTLVPFAHSPMAFLDTKTKPTGQSTKAKIIHII